MNECPQCASDDLRYKTIGQDQFGKIRILYCADCTWDEEDGIDGVPEEEEDK